MSRILLVSHDPVALRTLADELSALGHRPHLARSSAEALDIVTEEGGIAAVLADCVMPDRDGLALLGDIVARKLRVPVILLDPRDEATAATALRLGAADVLVRPFAVGRLAASIALVERLAALEDLVAAGSRAGTGQVRFSDIVTSSPGVERAVAQAARAARADMPVLIEGEAGVGKTLLARALHTASSRGGKPFLRLDCAVLSPAELDARLFGRRFRGVDEPGAVDAARGGTLYLKDIGSLPPAVQQKLLTLVETGEYQPEGSTRRLRADVRIIAATRIRLLNLARSGVFNEALFYRLGVMPIFLPPLRDRAEDIERLAALSLARAGAELGKPLRGLSGEALELVRGFAWPGNIRELESTLYRAGALARGSEIGPDSLPLLAPQSTANLDVPSPPIPVDTWSGPSPATVPDRFLAETGELRTLESVERELIVFALARHGNQMSRVARALGIGRSTLYRKLSEYGLAAPESGVAA